MINWWYSSGFYSTKVCGIFSSTALLFICRRGRRGNWIYSAFCLIFETPFKLEPSVSVDWWLTISHHIVFLLFFFTLIISGIIEHALCTPNQQQNSNWHKRKVLRIFFPFPTHIVSFFAFTSFTCWQKNFSNCIRFTFRIQRRMFESVILALKTLFVHMKAYFALVVFLSTFFSLSLQKRLLFDKRLYGYHLTDRMSHNCLEYQ